MDTRQQALNYVSPTTPTVSREPVLRIGLGHLWLAGFAFVVALLPHPTGIWYLGGTPKWLVAIDHSGLTIGPNDHPAYLGWFWFLLLKMACVLVPIWAAWRIRRRFKYGPESS
jgi:hypothetical protein